MSISLTRILQQITGLNTFFQGPNAGRSNGVVLEDSASVTWSTDGQGNIQATASASTLPTGSGNEVLATPANGSSGVSALRALVGADLPATTAFTNAANTFTASQTLGADLAFNYNGTHNWSINAVNDGNSALVVRDVTNAQNMFAVINFLGTSEMALSVPDNVGYVWSSNNNAYNAPDTGIYRSNTKSGVIQVGNGTANDVSGTVQAAFYVTGIGAQVTAAATISPTNSIHHVTGATPIATIIVPAGVTAGWQLILIPDDASGQTWLSTGNIGVAGAFGQYKAVIFTWDGTKFYPSSLLATS